MKKAILSLAILVMAFGNAGLAQRDAHQKSNVTANVFKHYGVRDETTVVPQTALCRSVYGETYRTTYVYDEYEFYLVEETMEIDWGEGWEPFERVTYEYDFSGNVLEIVVAEFEEGEWEDEQISTYTYDGEVLSEIVHQYWDGSAWQNDMKEVYNFNGEVATVLYWEWNGTTWSSSELYTYTFGQNSIEVLMQYMQGGAWQNEGKATYTLDFTGNVTEILEQGWVSSTWVNGSLTTYTYENGVFTAKLEKDWNGASWEDWLKYDFTYADGNATHGECMMMSGGEWYPADGDIEMAYGYNAATKEHYGWQVDVEYVDLTALDENATAKFLVYPVPAEGEIFIEAEDFQKAEIYSLTGRKLMESLQATLNVERLSSGLYVMKVYDREGKSQAQRFVVK